MRLLKSYCYADIRANPARHYFNDLECSKYLWSIHVTDLQSRTQVDLNRADLSAQRLDFDSIPIVDIADLEHGRYRQAQRGRRADSGRLRTCRILLCANVEGRAKDRDIGVDPIPVEHRSAFCEGARTDRRQVEAPGLVTMLRHHNAPRAFRT
jgi:hypothetical protein